MHIIAGYGKGTMLAAAAVGHGGIVALIAAVLVLWFVLVAWFALHALAHPRPARTYTRRLR